MVVQVLVLEVMILLVQVIHHQFHHHKEIQEVKMVDNRLEVLVAVEVQVPQDHQVHQMQEAMVV
tara:strand:+ start:154 stop:345 length:192 start_codon:yes stop_codon:yes gene_type:complete